MAVGVVKAFSSISLCIVAGALFGTSATAQPPTFAREIAPLLEARCMNCHHSGGDGPFSLVTYDEARQHARQIVEVTRRGYMPPWKPVGGGPFLGEPRLSETEQQLLARWVEAGSPEGAGPRATAPAFSAGWRGGTPDVVLTLPPYTLPAEGADRFRNFVVAVPGHGPLYVRAFEFRPGNRAVHHANLFVDRTPASRRLDDADPDAGYEGLILRSAEFPEGHFLGWTPGQAPPPASNELVWRVDGGSDLVVQLHMLPSGRPETLQPTIGLYLTSEPPRTTPTIVRLGHQDLAIPPGAAEHRVVDSFVLPVDVKLLAVQPHAHVRARRVAADATLPDGSTRRLIAIDDWDFRWQDQYRYAAPFWLPAGTTITATYTFDNSSNNPRNPDRPPQPVEWGWRTSDEMGDVWLQFATRSDDDRAVLGAAARRKMALEDTVGMEVLIRRTPDYAAVRNDAGLLYMELQRPQDALRHFEAVTRLTPAAAPAWFNEGVALEATGRRDLAEDRYRRAIALDPAYVNAQLALASLAGARGDRDQAARGYRAALALDPANADALCNLARLDTMAGETARAIGEFQQALALSPDWTACMVSYVWLLSAHADAAVRRPADAIVTAQRAVSVTRQQDAAALDALGVAYASAGRFDEAVAAGEAALRLAERQASPAAASEIRERVALYRQRKAVVVPN